MCDHAQYIVGVKHNFLYHIITAITILSTIFHLSPPIYLYLSFSTELPIYLFWSSCALYKHFHNKAEHKHILPQLCSLWIIQCKRKSLKCCPSKQLSSKKQHTHTFCCSIMYMPVKQVHNSGLWWHRPTNTAWLWFLPVSSSKCESGSSDWSTLGFLSSLKRIKRL